MKVEFKKETPKKEQIESFLATYPFNVRKLGWGYILSFDVNGHRALYKGVDDKGFINFRLSAKEYEALAKKHNWI